MKIIKFLLINIVINISLIYSENQNTFDSNEFLNKQNIDHYKNKRVFKKVYQRNQEKINNKESNDPNNSGEHQNGQHNSPQNIYFDPITNPKEPDSPPGEWQLQQDDLDVIPIVRVISAEQSLAMAIGGLLLNASSFRVLALSEKGGYLRQCLNEESRNAAILKHKKMSALGLFMSLFSLCSWFRGSITSHSSSDVRKAGIPSGAQGQLTGILAVLESFLSVSNYISVQNNVETLRCQQKDVKKSKVKKKGKEESEIPPEKKKEKGEPLKISHFKLDLGKVEKDQKAGKISLGAATDLIQSQKRGGKPKNPENAKLYEKQSTKII